MIPEITGAAREEDGLSTLSIETTVSLFEPAPRPATATTMPLPAHPAARAEAQAKSVRHGRRAAGTQATHPRHSVVSPAGLVQTGQLIAIRVLGTSLAAAVVTWALVSKSTGDAADVAALSLRGLAAAAVICAAWGFQDRARLGALGATRTWYGTAIALAILHTAWFTTTTPGRFQDHLSLVTAVFTLDVVLVVVPALLGARAGRPEGAAA